MQLYRSGDSAVFDELALRRWTGWDAAGVAWAYRSAIFCVHPPGERLSSHGLFDSMLLGCIPVILDREDAGAKGRAPVLPFSWGLAYSEFVVALPRATWDHRLVETLRAIPATRVRSMQLRLARAAPLLQYSLPPGGAATIEGIVARAMRRGGLKGSAGEDGEGEDVGASTVCATDAFDTLLATLYHRRLAKRGVPAAAAAAAPATPPTQPPSNSVRELEFPPKLGVAERQQ